MAEIKLNGLPHWRRWLIEIKSRPLEPREAEFLAMRLRKYRSARRADYTVIIAPYVSPASAQLLAEQDAGFCDLAGNCRIANGPLYLERSGFPNPLVRKSSQRSLYAPVAERVLRALLDPNQQGRSWTVRELAGAAYPGVSVGQTQKVLKILENWKFIQRKRGSRLVNAEALLKEWAAHYRFDRNRATGYYSMLNPDQMEKRFRTLLNNELGHSGMLALFSAAAIWAAHVRQHRVFLYWGGDREPLLKALEMKEVSSGENVVVYVPYDPGVYYPGSNQTIPVTGPVQTYLDLKASAARGEEAAEALFNKTMKNAYHQ
ncbi:MAG: type IV toxin-antitoxin system AbiEi family antitoxin [Candidatus Aureabacteria bacterium]|nr:type IV toxin-antitoxin system AbiEi family antitoxin [Candidatus Auribacterota bacterium]